MSVFSSANLISHLATMKALRETVNPTIAAAESRPSPKAGMTRNWSGVCSSRLARKDHYSVGFLSADPHIWLITNEISVPAWMVRLGHLPVCAGWLTLLV